MITRDKIKEKMILAMKNKDADTLSTVRLIMSKIKDKEISNRELGKEIVEGDVLQLLQQMVKQRNDSIAEYAKANRAELVKKEEQEIGVIREFMPEQLGVDEIIKVAEDAIRRINPDGKKDIGKVINLIKEENEGKIDMSVASKIIKEKLG